MKLVRVRGMWVEETIEGPKRHETLETQIQPGATSANDDTVVNISQLPPLYHNVRYHCRHQPTVINGPANIMLRRRPVLSRMAAQRLNQGNTAELLNTAHLK